MEKTIKYLENGEYHYATVRSVGDLAQLKTTSKETLVEAINELWNGGGNVDPSKVPNPEGYDKLVQDVADAVKNQQETNQQWIEWKKEEAQLTEERKQAYLQAMKEMQEAIDKAKADAAALGDKTAKLDEQITKTFSELNTNIQNMHEQLQKEADRMNQELIDTKSDLTKVRTDLQNAQLDNGRIHDELTNINGKFEHKVWQTDLDPLKAQIDRAETSVQQTKDELLGKASREDLDTVTNAVSKLDTQLKETAKGVEISVKKDELGGDVARLLNDKTNLLLGTRNFAGDKWSNLDHWHEEPGYWKGLKVFSSTEMWYGIQYQYEVKKGNQYTFSFYARQQSENNSAYIMLSEGNTGSQRACTEPYQKSDTHIGTEWKRYSLTFQAIADGTIYPRVEQSVANNTIYVAGYKLELGKNATPWEPNEADIAENIEHTESQFNVYSDQIAGIVKKQEKMGDTERQLDTRITETAEGLKQTSKDLQDANGKITEFKGQLESTAHGLKTEYEKYTNDAIGQISDSTLNLIRNSSFQNKDEDFDQWQNISAKANVRSDENGLRWVELTQSGLTTNNPEGITSNYFNIKQGKVTVAVDIKSGDKASLDNDSVLSLELYNDAKKRVDFYDVSLSQLGLSKELLGDHTVHRGLYRLGIDRNDAKYMTVKAKLVKNGDLYFTNFSARLSSIDDGAYEPNPDDINQQILKQNTKIEQNAKEVAIKANSVDVTRDIKSAVQNSNGGGVNLLRGTSPEWKTLTGGIWFTQTTSTGPIEIGSLAPGDTVTYTITVRNNSQYAVYPEIIGYSDDSGTRTFGVKKDEGVQPGETKTVSMSAAIAENTIKIVAWLATNDPSAPTFSVDAKNEKLEKGSVATPWTPAYEDISTEIKSAKDAAIQVASGQINLRVNELSTQFDDRLNKRINEQKTASEKFTSDGIEQVVTKITNVKGDVDRLGDKVNSFGGGVNLLLNSKDLHTGWSQDGTSVYKIDGYLAIKAIDGLRRIIENPTEDTNGKILSVSFDAMVSDDSKNKDVVIYAGPLQAAMGITISGNTFKRYKVENWKWNSVNKAFSIQFKNVGDKINLRNIKLEYGSVATPWSAAPQDSDTQTLYSANIDELKTQGHYFVRNLTGNPIGGWVYVDVTGNNNDRIRQDVYADQNNQHKYRSWNGSRWSGWEQGAYISDVNNVKTEVTASVKNLGDRVITQVNSVETRVNNKVDNLQVGGRNLLIGTGEEEASGKAYHFADYQISGGLQPNKTYTLSGWARVDQSSMNHHQNVFVDAYSEDWSWSVSLNISSSLTSQYNKITFTTPSGKQLHPSVTVYLSHPDGGTNENNNDAISGTAFIKKLKLEVGNKATDWSPAPEDVNNKIDGIQVGGRNILSNTENLVYKAKVTNSTNNPNSGDSMWKLAVGNLSDWLRNNPDVKEIAISYDYELQGATPTGTIRFGVNQAPAWEYMSGFNLQGKPAKGRVKLIVPVTDNMRETASNISRIRGDGLPIGATLIISHPKWEVGNKATDWSPAPEDTVEAIKQLNTKWDVANGQIQGKVTETQVNNILNGKGYATQSWAQTQFQMRSDAITLQAVRDNITNGIQNQVNDTRNQINGLQNQFNTQTGINLLKGTADFSGPWFNKNGKGWSCNGEWQPPTSENKSERNNNVVYQDSGHAWDGLGQTVELDTGEYTFSMWMWPTLSGNESMSIYMGDSQYGGTAKVNYSGYSYSASQPQNRWILVKTYLTVTQGGKLSIRPELNQASGTIHVASYMLQHGHVENPVWAPAPDDLAPKSIISSINITPDQIKIASNKIVIDGNTDIHGVLRVPDVKLAGRNGNVDLSGDGINITKTNGAGINIANNGIQLTANTNGQNEVEGVLTTAWSMNNKNQNGIGLVITPEQTLGRPYGGDILTIGSMVAPGTIHAAMVFDATGINPDYRRGFNWFAPHTLNGDGGVLRFPGAQDDLMLYPGNMPESRQSEYSQPTLRLVHGNSQSSAGIQFQWDDIVPFGRITSSMSYVSAVGTDDDGGITVSWYSYGAWYNGRKAPSIVYRGSDGNRGNGGIVFYPYGEVCFWQGDFHSNLRWSGMKNTD